MRERDDKETSPSATSVGANEPSKLAWRARKLLGLVVRTGLVLLALIAVGLIGARETGWAARLTQETGVSVPSALVTPSDAVETLLVRMGFASGAARLAQMRAYATKERARWERASLLLLDARLFPAAYDAAERAQTLKTEAFTRARAAALNADGRWEELHVVADGLSGAQANLWAAQASVRLGDPRHALATLGAGDSIGAWFVRGEALLALGRTEEALDAHARILDATDAAEVDRCVALARLARYEEALPVCRAHVDANPRDAERWRALAIALETSGDDRAARRALDRATALRPDDAELRARRDALQTAP